MRDSRESRESRVGRVPGPRPLAPGPRLSLLLAYAALVVGSGIVLIPFVWLLSTSLKDPSKIFLDPPLRPGCAKIIRPGGTYVGDGVSMKK